MMDITPLTPQPLSPEIVAKIDALAKQISVAEDLDGEIQAELRGHIEDKLRGYLSGEVRVSEGDAMVLAKAHFGEVGVVKGMLQGVHRVEHATSLARRLVAVFLATIFVLLLGELLETSWVRWVVLPGILMGWDHQQPQFPRILHAGFELFRSGLVVVLLWKILAVWRKRESTHGNMWFVRWNWFTLFTLIVGVVATKLALECILNAYSSAIDSRGEVTNFLALRSTAMEIVRVWIIPLFRIAALALLWIWWSDRAPRTRRGLLVTVPYWIAASQAIIYVTPFYDVLSHSFVRGHFDATDISRFLSLQGLGFFINLGWNLLAGLIAWLLYVSFLGRRRAEMA